MRWRVFTVGEPALSYAAEGVREYARRLGRGGWVEVVAVKVRGGRNSSAALLEACTERYRIALDEGGSGWTSRGLARHVGRLELRGIGRAGILVGGADGHSRELLESCDEVWSLSPLTLQHELALVVLLEQLYRVHAIRSNLPYHRDGESKSG